MGDHQQWYDPQLGRWPARAGRAGAGWGVEKWAVSLVRRLDVVRYFAIVQMGEEMRMFLVFPYDGSLAAFSDCEARWDTAHVEAWHSLSFFFPMQAVGRNQSLCSKRVPSVVMFFSWLPTCACLEARASQGWI